MRDLSIDAVRGLCIASMIVAHVSMGSVLYSLSHVQLWTDAAFGFVALSGLVVGIVHRRKSEKVGAPAYLSVMKRVWILYLAQFAILVLALVVRSLGTKPEELPEPADFGGWWESIALIATLQMPAPNLTILPMYVGLLLGALGVLALLARGMVVLPLILSGAIYVASIIFPDQTVLPYLAADPAPQFNWASWQLPFVWALVLGWHWTSGNVREIVLSKYIVGFAAFLAGLIFVLAQVVERTSVMSNTSIPSAMDIIFHKFNLGPGSIIYGFAGLILVYWLAVRCTHVTRLQSLLDILMMVGQRSLDSFVILCLAVILLPAIFGHDQDSLAGMASAVVVFAVCWIWAKFRRTHGSKNRSISDNALQRKEVTPAR